MNRKNNFFNLVSIIIGKRFLQVGNETFELNKGEHLILPGTLKTFVLEGQFESNCFPSLVVKPSFKHEGFQFNIYL
ncbi:hypothetical protein [Cytobacillus oceanisediminis]|uniref:hypothetical protein n=1 Tax=Cytobacillus oceanisediminis TaxID=665099 RepID=UPI000D717804